MKGKGRVAIEITEAASPASITRKVRLAPLRAVRQHGEKRSQPSLSSDGTTGGAQVNRIGDRGDKSRRYPENSRGSDNQRQQAAQGKGAGGKEYPKPNPQIPYIPPPDYKGGCWWCYRRGLSDDHDYKACKGRLAGRAGFEKIKLARTRSRSQGPPQGEH